MTTYPLTFPSAISVNSLRVTPTNAVVTSQSPFSFSAKSYSYTGEMWRFEASIPPLTRAQAEELLTFLIQLKGSFGTFTAPIFDAKEPRGLWTGTPLVDGAGQTGNTLNIKTSVNNVTGYALKGDFIQLGSGASTRLYKIMNDADTDAGGLASLTLYPAIATPPIVRSSPNDNDPIVFNNCHGLFKLDGDFTYDVDINKFYGVNISAYEAI